MTNSEGWAMKMRKSEATSNRRLAASSTLGKLGRQEVHKWVKVFRAGTRRYEVARYVLAPFIPLILIRVYLCSSVAD